MLALIRHTFLKSYMSIISVFFSMKYFYGLKHTSEDQSEWVLVAQLCSTVRSHGLQPTRLLDHGILHAQILEWEAIPIFQGIFLIQGLNLGLLHYRQIHYHLSHQGSPRRAEVYLISQFICFQRLIQDRFSLCMDHLGAVKGFWKNLMGVPLVQRGPERSGQLWSWAKLSLWHLGKIVIWPHHRVSY